MYSGGVRLTTENEYNGQDTQVLNTLQSSRLQASMQGGMDEMIRMHSSANFSFDLNHQNHGLHFDPIDAQRKARMHIAKEQQQDALICRICLCEEEGPDHELVAPCKCGGSMRYVGLSCLKSWLEGKRHCKETHFVNSYIWKGLECEICKQPYKDTFIG